MKIAVYRGPRWASARIMTRTASKDDTRTVRFLSWIPRILRDSKLYESIPFPRKLFKLDTPFTTALPDTMDLTMLP